MTTNDINVRQALMLAYQLFPQTNNPYDICRQLGLDIILDKPMHKDGYLVCEDGCKLIFVSSRITNRHRRKFIVTHELGHFLMHRSQLYCCANVSELGSTKVNTSAQEREANAFASEYLIPSSQLVNLIPQHSLHFSDISQIASHFGVSMTFAAIKSVQYSNTENEILLCYKDQQCQWFASGDKALRFQMIPAKCPIDLSSMHISQKITGVWDSLYDGSVHQEIFRPYRNTHLILLSGERHISDATP